MAIIEKIKKPLCFTATLCLFTATLFVSGCCDAPEPQPETGNICNVDNPLTDLPWLKEIVDRFEQDTVTLRYNPHVRIYQCDYRDGVGFWIEMCVDCPDAGYSFRNCEGDVLCSGGGSSGEEECAIEFAGKELIWEKKREEDEFLLTNTRWKLIGIVDAQTGELRELVYHDRFFTGFLLHFDWTRPLGVTGTSSGNSIAGNYSVDYDNTILFLTTWAATDAGESGDGYLYTSILYTTERDPETRELIPKAFPFKRYRDVLYLFYNDNRNYLAYRRVEL